MQRSPSTADSGSSTSADVSSTDAATNDVDPSRSITSVDAPSSYPPVPDDDGLVRTGDGSATLHHPDYNQTYHSHHGAITESQHVFLAHSGLRERLADGPVTLLEIGIGTGLNLALSASLALHEAGELHYQGIEQCPPPSTALRALQYEAHDAIDEALWLRILDGFEARETHLDLPHRGTIQCHWANFHSLTLPTAYFDIIYHDAFSPDVNGELWTLDALTTITNALKMGGVLVTYTVQGSVRRLFQQLGLQVERLPGPPGGKRQVLRVTKAAPTLT